MDKTMIRASLSLLLMAWLVGCVDERAGATPEDTSSISILLQSTTSGGTTYRLRDFNVELVGPVSVTLSSESFASTATVMNARLPSGTYTASVQDGWRLERVDVAGAYPVPAYLAQPSLDFSVLGGQTASVSFAFRTDSDFAIPGGVNVGFSVDDTAPTSWNTGFSASILAGVASDDMGNVYALYRSGGTLSVQSFTSWGAARFNVYLPVPGSLTSLSAFDIEAISEGRVRIAWNASDYLQIVTLDATTGAVMTQMQRAFSTLGFLPVPIFGNEGTLAIAIGRLGSVAVASMPDTSNPDSSRLAYIVDGGATSAYGVGLGVRVISSATNKIKLTLSGLDEDVLIAYPTGSTSTLQRRTETGALIWSQSSALVSDLAADTVGNLFVLRSAGQLARYARNDGSVLWTFALGAAAGSSRIAAGASGVVLVSNFVGPLRARVLNLTGTVTRDETFGFTQAMDVPTGVALDVASGIAVTVTRTGGLVSVGRLAP